MINNVSQSIIDMFDAPSRSFRGRVEIYEGSTLARLCGCHDNLKDFTVERVGEHGKFFGFGICQKLTVNLIDNERVLNIAKDSYLEVELGVGVDYVYPYPRFFIESISRDETTNEIKIEAYDALNAAAAHTVEELELPGEYTLKDVAVRCATLLGLPLDISANAESFELFYPNGANLEGTETIREVLNAIAEATLTIYYIDSNWNLCFKRIVESDPYYITKEHYFELKAEEPRTLASIVETNELGDSIGAARSEEGETQYIRNNPFLELREDRVEFIENAITVMGGRTIIPFDCSWRGNFLLEIGDVIGLQGKNDENILTFILDDSLTFNGGLSATTQWDYEAKKESEHTNPTSLGEALKQTFAKVDKANKKIEMLVSSTENNANEISVLQLTSDSISATVSQLQTNTKEALEEVNENITQLTSQVSAQITAEDIQLQISQELSNGVDKVETATGFTFNNDGLTVAKSDSEMTTQITEDGMKIYKKNEAVLTVDNTGVNARNLHATTYLLIGSNSRFEDYGNRTGCFWIGG
ncbi:MAG: hypothetical protein IKT27_03070 [Clostridia bacterium]|nr:hypothetical protein [Clostridia bacterium]